MPRVRRRFLVDPTEVGVYHCINRCVRRSFLCGKDPLSGRDYNHRPQWIQDRIQFLAGHFGVDVLGFAMMRKAADSAGGHRAKNLGILVGILSRDAFWRAKRRGFSRRMRGSFSSFPNLEKRRQIGVVEIAIWA